MKRIIVNISDHAVGVEGLEGDTEVEVRCYRSFVDLRAGDAAIWRQDEDGNWYTEYLFSPRDSLVR